jgi:LacI family transcriptional regulator
MAVSLALRGRSGVSDATRRKILKVAGQLGYRPDPEVAKLLAHIRSAKSAQLDACLALLTSGSRAREWQRFVTERKYVEGAQARAKQYGYRLEEFWINEPGMTAARLGQIMWSRGIEGVVVAPLQGKLSRQRTRSLQLDFSPFAAVEISETVEWPDLDRAIHDQYTAMMRTLEEVALLGYRRPGLVLEEALDLRVNGKWTSAFLYHRTLTGQRHMPPPLIMAAPDAKVFERWLTRHGPDVIISVDQFGLQLIKDHGWKIPKQIGYASLDVDGDAKLLPAASGIDQNSAGVGAAAVDMLVAAIQRGQRGIPTHRVHTEIAGLWRAGTSLTRQRRPPA